MAKRSTFTKLSKNCGMLLFCSELLEGSNTQSIIENNRIIKQALRKIIIANEIDNRSIICVTGLQGTGKTTLMKNYFDLDDEIMNISTGRGERLPILITEGDVKKPILYAVGIKKCEDGYCDERKIIEKEEFIEYSRAEDEDTTIMFLEMSVPRKDNNSLGNRSYMLLPGYEKTESYWNTLIEYSVHCAKTAIFVLAPDSLADAENADLLNKIHSKFGNNVIYVISHSDEKADANEALKKTLMEKVHASNEDAKRFVCAGAYPEHAKNEIWKQRLQEAIELYSADPQTADQKNTEYLEKIIALELRPALIKIKNHVTDITEDFLSGVENLSWLNKFDDAKAKYRKFIEKNLDESFQDARNKDEDDIVQLLEYGQKLPDTIENLDPQEKKKLWLKALFNKGEYTRRVIFGDSLKDTKRAKETILEAMKDKDGGYRYQKAFSKSVVKSIDELSVSTKKISDNRLHFGDSKNVTTLLGSKNEEDKKKILQDMTTILSVNTNEDIPALVALDTSDTMVAMVECATIFFCMNMIDPEYIRGYDNTPSFSKSELTLEDIKRSIKETEKFALSILGVTGLDLIGDGVINFVPQLAKALSISEPAAGAIVAGIIGTGMLVSFMNDYNATQLKDFYSFRKAIAASYDSIENNYLSEYDEYMDIVRERVERYLTDCLGVHDAEIHKQNAIIAIKNINANLKDISAELKGDSYDPTKLIRG